ncbi:S-layer homology domain-containing protein [Candidatus Gracilibacteria bacterium]|nr:S-layer homology domain-containing protein [Candidatus Gracilibacteria bacterium]
MYRLIPLLIAHISPKWYNKKIEKVQSTFHMDIKNKIQTLLNNKNFYLGISAAVTVVAVIIMAIYFGSGALFKGYTPLVTYKCAANPNSVSAGQQNQVTWSAYNILPLPGGTKVGSIFENLGTTSVSTNDFKDYYAIYPANTPAGTITATAHINSTTSVTCQLKINPVQYPECTPGQTTQQTCPNGTDKKTSTCGSEGYWGAWSPQTCPTSWPECTPGQTTQQTCSNGTTKQTSTCDSEGYWGAWNPQTCQIIIPKLPIIQNECTPGQTTQQTCSNGTTKQTSTCDSEGYWGAWNPQNCPTGGTECTAGATTKITCPNGTDKLTSTCDNGYWGPWVPQNCPSSGGTECTPNTKQTRLCPNGTNTQTSTCSSSGTWGSWSPDCPTTTTATGTTSTFNNLQLSESLLPEKEMVTCNISPETIAPKYNERITARCTLMSPSAQVKTPMLTAKIIKGSFDPVKGIGSKEEIVKSYFDDQLTAQGGISITWDGKKYGQPVADGDYTFIIAARLNKQYNYNYFLKNFKVTSEQPKAAVQTETTTTTTTTEQPQTETKTEQPTQTVQPEVAQPEPREASKCPGVYYCTDIKGHWAEQYFRDAQDKCIITGYADGTCQPDKFITRFQAVKILVSLVSHPWSCYDADCGTPFIDLVIPMGSWVRPAYEAGISRGFGQYFLPNRSLTRAEAFAMIVRAFTQKLKPYSGCYSPNCGAGHPNNLFIDITDSWSGKYIRALWDAGLVKGKEPNIVDPYGYITRAEFLKTAISAAAL